MPALRYLELKSGHHDNGPAWIGYVALSRSKTTIYFNGRALQKISGGGLSSNYRDLNTGEQFWVSGVKKNGEDRLHAKAVPVLVEAAAVSEYLGLRGLAKLDSRLHKITDDIVQTDIAACSEKANAREMNLAEQIAEIIAEQSLEVSANCAETSASQASSGIAPPNAGLQRAV